MLSRKTGAPKLAVLALLLAAIFACDRTSRDYAGKAAPAAPAVQYTVSVQRSTVPGVSYRKSVLPQGETGPTGQALFLANCIACHQVTGTGVPGAFPPLDGSKYVQSDKVDRMASIMLYGLMGPIQVNGMTFAGAMTPFGALLKDEELAAIATYVRGAWSNRAGPVGPEVFAAARAKWGARGPFVISELGAEP